jgi:hypothetical protein
MAKKQKSFAEKASSTGGKDLVHVKFVKSVASDREGFWRFNESMITMEKGQNLDAKLKEIEDEAKLVDIDMPSKNGDESDSKKPKSIEASSSVEAPAEEATTEETPVEEVPAEEAPAEEATTEEVPVEEATTEAAPTEEATTEETPVEEVPAEEEKTK